MIRPMEPNVYQRIDWAEVGRHTRQGDWRKMRTAMARPADTSGRAQPWPTTEQLAELRPSLDTILREAVSRAHAEGEVKALYFEVEPGQGLTGIFLCQSFLPEEDWAGDYVKWVEGPRTPPGSGWDEEHMVAAAGAVLEAFGQALDGLDARPPWPVGMGIHDCDVLLAPIPDGVVPPEDLPRSVIPEPQAGAYYLLSPFHPASPTGCPVRAADDLGEAWMKTLYDWGQDRPRVALPDGDVVLRLVGSDFEDCLQTTQMSYVVSERLIRSLARHAAPGEGHHLREVTLVHATTGEARPYAAYRPSTVRGAVDLAPEHWRRVARGRSWPVFRAGDLRGVNVFAEDGRVYCPPYVAIVSGETLTRLREDDCLTGISARSLIVLEADELEP